jgi:large subunit ribosomal protein L32
MAVPKKRTSQSKKNSRRANWINKANKQAKKSYSLASSVVSGKLSNFFYNLKLNEKV